MSFYYTVRFFWIPTCSSPIYDWINKWQDSYHRMTVLAEGWPPREGGAALLKVTFPTRLAPAFAISI